MCLNSVSVLLDLYEKEFDGEILPIVFNDYLLDDTIKLKNRIKLKWKMNRE